MQMDRLTLKSQEALSKRNVSRAKCRTRNGRRTSVAGPARQSESLVPELQKIGVPPAKLQSELEHECPAAQGEGGRRFMPANPAQGARCRTIRGRQTQGRLRQHEHLLLGLLDDAVRC